MDLLISGFTDFANEAINNGAETAEEGVKYMINLNQEFKYDKVFNELFPIIFMMEICNRKINEEKKDEDVIDESYEVTI